MLYFPLKYAAYLVSAYFGLSLFFGKLLGNATGSVISYKSCKIVQLLWRVAQLLNYLAQLYSGIGTIEWAFQVSALKLQVILVCTD